MTILYNTSTYDEVAGYLDFGFEKLQQDTQGFYYSPIADIIADLSSLPLPIPVENINIAWTLSVFLENVDENLSVFKSAIQKFDLGTVVFTYDGCVTAEIRNNFVSQTYPTQNFWLYNNSNPYPEGPYIPSPKLITSLIESYSPRADNFYFVGGGAPTDAYDFFVQYQTTYASETGAGYGYFP